MMRLFRRFAATRTTPPSFCDPCGQVCTSACRSEALRDRTRTAVLVATLYR